MIKALQAAGEALRIAEDDSREALGGVGALQRRAEVAAHPRAL